jgi:hypothetical protein
VSRTIPAEVSIISILFDVVASSSTRSTRIVFVYPKRNF